MNIDASLSGLQAASARLLNSADNTANMFSTSSLVRGEYVAKPYQPTDLVQSSLEPSSGVRTARKVRIPSTLAVYDPSSFAANDQGIVDYPNVSAEQETIEQMISSAAFQSNLRSLQAELDMQDSLLDVAA